MRLPSWFVAGALVLAAVARASAEEDAKEDVPPRVRTLKLDGLSTPNARLELDVYEARGGPAGRPVVVTMCKDPAERRAWEGVALRLAECGISFVAFDDGDEPGAVWAHASVSDLRSVSRWVEKELRADAGKVALAASGEHAESVLLFATQDPAAMGTAAIAAALLVGPRVGKIDKYAAVTDWDDRPVALVAGGKSPSLQNLRKLEASLAKRPRAETILIDGAAEYGSELLPASPTAVLEIAQWFHGRLQRPSLDGKPDASDQAPSWRPGQGAPVAEIVDVVAGGLRIEAAGGSGSLRGLGVLADPDPAATSLNARTRRLTITPAKGSGLRISVRVARWTGKAWQTETTLELSDCGGFERLGGTEYCEIWLPPRVLGAAPFGTVAAAVRVVDPDRPVFEDDPPAASAPAADGAAPRRPFREADPSSWTAHALR